MLGTAALIAFVATTEPTRAKTFYGATLGLALVADEQFALVYDANGTMLRIQKVSEHVPVRSTALGWKVSDIREAVASLSAKGVRFQRFAGLTQDADGIWTSPLGPLVAWFKDPDGNVLSLTQLA